jgi:hypothetical protein
MKPTRSLFYALIVTLAGFAAISIICHNAHLISQPINA